MSAQIRNRALPKIRARAQRIGAGARRLQSHRQLFRPGLTALDKLRAIGNAVIFSAQDRVALEQRTGKLLCSRPKLRGELLLWRDRADGTERIVRETPTSRLCPDPATGQTLLAIADAMSNQTECSAGGRPARGCRGGGGKWTRIFAHWASETARCERFAAGLRKSLRA
jgi:hypothetical protein